MEIKDLEVLVEAGALREVTCDTPNMKEFELTWEGRVTLRRLQHKDTCFVLTLHSSRPATLLEQQNWAGASVDTYRCVLEGTADFWYIVAFGANKYTRRYWADLSARRTLATGQLPLGYTVQVTPSPRAEGWLKDADSVDSDIPYETYGDDE